MTDLSASSRELLDAAMFDNVEDLVKCLNAGASLKASDQNGYTAMHWASSRGYAQVVSVLLSRGAEVDPLDKMNWTPLHLAAEKEHLRIVEILLAAGANPNLKTKQGKAPGQLTKNKAIVAALKSAQSTLKREVAALKKAESHSGGLGITRGSSIANMLDRGSPSHDANAAHASGSPTGRDSVLRESTSSISSNLDLRLKGTREVAQMRASLRGVENLRVLMAEIESMEAESSCKAMDLAKRETLCKERSAKQAIEIRELDAKLAVLQNTSDALRVEEEDVAIQELQIKDRSLKAEALDPVLDMLVSQVAWNDISMLTQLGAGGQSAVYSAVWRGEAVAVKKLQCDPVDRRAIENFKRESVLLSKFRHPNVVLLMGVCMDPNHPAILTELMEGGDLSSLLASVMAISWLERYNVAIDIARGMQYLHTMVPPVVHRDLKSLNVLLDSTGRAKVSDFGISRSKVTHNVETTATLGTPAWMAPEILRGEPFDEKSDVYSFGVILWELLMRKTPWEGVPPLKLVQQIGFSHELLPLPLAPPRGCCREYLELIQDCWNASFYRPSFHEIFERLVKIAIDESNNVQASERI